MIRFSARAISRARAAACAVVLGNAGLAAGSAAMLLASNPVHAQAVYATPDAAASAFADALASNDRDALHKVLGNDSLRFIPAESFDEDDVYRFLGAWAQGHRIVDDAAPLNGRPSAHVEVGASGWTLPIPLVKAGQGWRFDPQAARDEILTRTIGRNENAAMLTSLAYVDAQGDYHDLTQHYASRFVSTPGKRDGLYWSTAPGEAESPLGPLAAVMGKDTSPDDAYHGYHYRILTGQGTQAKGGAKSYLENGKLENGFALVAWPAQYGKTGVMSFIVNQDGQLFQKNLGPQTARVADAIKSFNPDSSWAAVTP